MMRCGLLGRKLGHSYSPQIHRQLGSYSYDLYELEPEQLGDFLAEKDFRGLNVTIPYKKSVIPYLDTLSPEAQLLGSVNTIVRQADGTLAGHNTDYYGFKSLLKKSGICVNGKKVLVLGSGGASCTAVHALQEAGADAVVISRSGANNYSNLHLHQDAEVIVNTTPVGMYPENGISPVTLDIFPNLHGVIDLIYNPYETTLLQDARHKGIRYINGLWMLVAQAKESAEWFTGTSIPETVIEPIYHQLKKQMLNIVLIGMPGSGKTTVAKELSRKLRRPLIDADECIASAAGKSIPEIFANEGEAAFRKLETKVLKELCKQSGIVLSTGGGCVTVSDNEDILRQNGIIYWIQRDTELLPREGRPISLTNSLQDLYNRRAPLYSQFSDISVSNSTTVNDAADRIIQHWEEQK